MTIQDQLRALASVDLFSDGALLAITDRGADESYEAFVDEHLGRYFYAGGHRFHVADDFRPMGDRRVWKTAAATALLLTTEEAAATPVAAAPALAVAPVTGIPVMEPIGPAEPTEHW